MSTSRPIGIGFVGAGANTRLRHLPGFAAIDSVRLVTVANRSGASSLKVAAEFGIASARLFEIGRASFSRRQFEGVVEDLLFPLLGLDHGLRTIVHRRVVRSFDLRLAG